MTAFRQMTVGLSKVSCAFFLAVISVSASEPTPSLSGSCVAPDLCSQAQILGLPEPDTRHFGTAMDAQGDELIIGADGAAYYYRWQDESWILHQTLQGAGSFGARVALQGNFLAVSGSGGVYVFGRTGDLWVQDTLLTPTPNDSSFGSSVDVESDVVAVSAASSRCPNGEFNCGAVYVFRKTGSAWVQEAQIRADNPSAGDLFGTSVDLDANRLAIGSPNRDCPGSSGWCGAVYVFQYDQTAWVLEQILYDATPLADADFGHAVALEGSFLAIGAPYDYVASLRPGTVSVFQYESTQWNAVTKFVPPWVSLASEFGKNVAIDADHILVTSDTGKEACANLNSIHRFVFDGAAWSPAGAGRFTPAPYPEYHARSVAVSGSRMMAGYPSQRCGSVPCGMVRVMSVGAALADCDCDGTADLCEPGECAFDCNSNTLADSCDIVSGSSSDCNADGIPDECGSGTGDCNDNGIFDVCDIWMGPSEDCNLNQTPDECDVVSGYSNDADQNGVPDECPVGTPGAPELTSLWNTSRFVAFAVPPAIPPQTTLTALRVDMIWVHYVLPPYSLGPSVRFTELEGEHRWVGPPVQYVESSANPQTFFASKLQCTPYYQDWSTVGTLHVTGAAIVPSSSYEIVNVSHACQNREATCGVVSEALELRTTRWGDVELPFSPPSPIPEPDIADISALVNKFVSAPNAPIKARTLLAGPSANGELNLSLDLDFNQISAVVDAFKGKGYPYKVGLCSQGGGSCNKDADCCCGAVCVLCE